MNNNFDIAIIGMSCRFPGAKNISEFWKNLSGGVESIKHFTDEELMIAGIAESLISNPKYVKASPVLKDPGLFDARFFGLTPNEARTMDPQHRILLECSQEALEHAGYDPERFDGKIGVYAGSAMNTYFINDFLRSRFIDEYIPTLIANDKDFLSTLISYKLNLKGPSINVQTACSTSLVAVHLGCQSLISYESDMVLAGAVSVKVPHISGYICDGGGVVSPDAHVRAFDAQANGTVFGSGAGIVVLKRLSDAIKDNDTIHAIIKGTAVNNDGSQKAGFTAPSVNSQADVVIEALSVADINPETISYLEAHGSGTPIGDPIELSALTKAFRNYTKRNKFCAIGSVKTNVGHLDVAAGAAGLIKTVLALKNKKIPPSLNYSNPNPEIDFNSSPFYVNTKLADWKSNYPLRAGIMSTGMGGTNAHIILEEAPQSKESGTSSKPKLFVLSVKSESALKSSTKRLAEFLSDHPEVNGDDCAHTLQVGRKLFNHRRFFVSTDRFDALELLKQENSKRVFSGTLKNTSKRPIVFLLPGIGDHYVGMGYDLYQDVKVFREEVDRCSEILKSHIDVDIREIIYPSDFKRNEPDSSKGINLKKMLSSRVNKFADTNTQRLNQTLYAQPALFTIEYALAKLWMHLGIIPDAIVGHSMGEYVSACLSGVLSLEDALKLIAVRAKLVNTLPQSSMLAVSLSEKELLLLINDDISISLVNLPDLCIIVGSKDNIKSLEGIFKEKKILFRYVQNAHAFHSRMLDPIVDDFVNEVKDVILNSPQIPYTSNLTGSWISEKEVKDPSYWGKHANHTARFSDALEKAWLLNNCILLEVGPSNTLSVLAMQHPQRMKSENPTTIASLRADYDSQSDLNFILNSIGKLWLNGVNVNCEKLYENYKPKRIPLPTYPFEREYYWVDDLYSRRENISYQQKLPQEKRKEFKDWFYKPSWKKSVKTAETNLNTDYVTNTNWLIFSSGSELEKKLIEKLNKLSCVKVIVKNGSGFSYNSIDTIELNPQSETEYNKLFYDLSKQGFHPDIILHFWNYDAPNKLLSSEEELKSSLYRGIYSLLFIVKSLQASGNNQKTRIGIITKNLHAVLGNENLASPDTSMILGPSRVVNKEIENVLCKCIDFSSHENNTEEQIALLLNKSIWMDGHEIIAFRENYSWSQSLEQINITEHKNYDEIKLDKIKPGGVYLITGGTGGLGLTFAEYFAQSEKIKLILIKKSDFPLREKWTKENGPKDKTTEIINQISQIEKQGSIVEVHVCDISNESELKALINQVKKKYGKIDGIIHAAGIIDDALLLTKTPESIKRVLSAKVYGTRNLANTLNLIDLDFFILFSSINSYIAPVGQIDYSAANNYLDAFANLYKSLGANIVSINWPGWREKGILAELKVRDGLKKWKEKTLDEAISSEDGLKAFILALKSGLSQVVINPIPLFPINNEIYNSKSIEFNSPDPKSRLMKKPQTESFNLDSVDNNLTEVIENKLFTLWQNILGYDNIQKDDNFFDLGGHSLLMGRLQIKINEVFDKDISLIDLYEYPTIKSLAKYISNQQEIIHKPELTRVENKIYRENRETDIAIIGMAGRYPKANNIKKFWNNLLEGVEAISFFTDEELEYLPKGNLNSELKFIKARGILENVDKFDAEFFGYNPREAAIMDPQHRIFLECAWEALEDAGYNSENYEGSIGVFAGAALSTYMMFNVFSDRRKLEEVISSYQIAEYVTITGSDNSFLPTKVAYKLGLRGPAINIQSACSTSLVAIGQAYQNLLSGECDMALAGGVSITFPQKRGYFYVDGSIGSIDGHCKPFDADATGTIFSSAAGIIVLKRLQDAIKDGDSIYAVIKSVALNNDGSNKAGYMTPSVDGQAAVIRRAQQIAGINPSTIRYIETHGTGTPVGDPIEIKGLEKAFRESTNETQFCGIGSVKSNVGHTDIAAGVTGIIKTALSLKNRVIPPTLHYKNPNPKIDFKNSPFFVVDKLTNLGNTPYPIHAAVSAFGVGGTNAHAILEEFSESCPEFEKSIGKQILVVSAKTETALKNNLDALMVYLNNNPNESITNVAFTLQEGRKEFAWRQFVVADNNTKASEEIAKAVSSEINKGKFNSNDNPHLVFMFPGQGAQYVNMGKGLYESEELFREMVDHCAEFLKPHLKLDIRDLLFPENINEATAEKLEQTVYTQPALFIIEYALAQLLLSYGIRPGSMIGHSIGDYVAACLAGVFSVEDALYIIAMRARLMQKQQPGSMLSVRLNESDIKQYLNEDICLAAINSPLLTVLSGPTDRVKDLSEKLTELKIENRVLYTSHAYHSRMMEPALQPFTDEFSKITLNKPTAPLISSLTGTWITDEQATDPNFWASQLRNPVRFSSGITELQKKNNLIFIELGPGRALSTMVSQHRVDGIKQSVFTTLTKPNEDIDDQKNFYSSIGKLWVAGLKIDWKNFHKNKKRRRIHLPTYQFDRKSYWIEPPKANITELEKLDTVQTRQSIKRVVKKPSIKKVIQETSMTRKENIILLLKDVLEELSGINKAQLDETKTFVEQGFDSLFMTQVTLGFQKKFDVKITLRQLLETNPNLLSIADYIDSKLPEGKFEPVKQEVIVEEESEEDVEEFDEATAYFEEEQQNNYNQSKNNVVEKLVFEQLEIMKKQLKLLGGKEIKTPVIQTQLAKKEKEDNVPVISSSIGSEIVTPPKEEKKVFERFGPYKPIETKKGSALTSQQQKYLDKLIRDYNKKTKNSKKLTQQHRAHYADPRTVSGFLPIWKEMTYQVVTERSEGARLWDIDGNEYIDVLMGFGQYLFGHNPKFIRDVILEQIPKGFEIGPQSPIAGEVAKLICELTGMERAGFCVTGSEAVLGAIRAARTVSGKDKIVFFTGDYHGIIDEVLVKTNVIGNTLKTMPIAPGIPRENVQNSIVLEYGTEESLKAIEKLLPEIAAVMVEPVQSRRLDFQPKDFLQKLRKMTEEAKVALIFDEVITGFRSCQGGAQEWFGVRADISTYGKVIGGGFPIGIIAGKSLYMDAFDGGMWQYGDESIPEAGVTFFAGTFVRHPLSLTGALASLKYLKSKNGTLQASLNKKTAELTEELNAFFTQINMPLKMINFSSIFYYAYPKDLSYFNLLFYVLRNKGLHILEGFPIFLSEAHNDKDIKFIIEVFKESVVELQDNGFFPAPLTIDEKKKINVPIGQALEENKYPLTDAQMEIWVASLLNENASCAFNESSHLVFKGNLSKDAMEKAFNKLIERHEALRTTFSSDGQYQLVHNNSNFKLIFTDISKFNDDEKKKITSDKINSETSKAFDLINGPLLRAELIKLEEEDHRLTITAHHIICDGWSYDVMVKDLSRIYSEEVEQNFVEIKTPTQMREFVSFSEEIKKTSEYKEQEKYWLNKLASPRNESELPTDYPRPKVRTFNGSRVTVQINSALFKNTKDLSAKSGNTLFVTLLSAFSLLLYKLTQDEDVITGIPVAGQQIVGAHDLVGHCTNLLPIRFNVEPDLKFSDYLKLVKSLVLDAYDNQQVTYGDIISKLKIKRNAGKPPLLSTMFNVDPSIMGLNFSGVECDFLPSQIAGYQFEFGFNLVNYSNTYSIECEYNPDLFSSKTAEKFINYYNYILEQIVEDIDKPLKGFQIISSSEIMNILNNFNDKKS